MKTYVELQFSTLAPGQDHRLPTVGMIKTAIVAMPNVSKHLTTFEMLAKEKLCKELNVKNDLIVITDYKVLSDVIIIE